MANETNIPFNVAAKNCLAAIKAVEEKSAPILERIKSNDLGVDFVDKVRTFLNDFDSVSDVFSKLPIEDGIPTQKMTEIEKREVGQTIPELVAGLERLAEGHALIIATLKKCMEANSDRMDLMRKSKKIFDKFIKAKQSDPRFFDRRL